MLVQTGQGQFFIPRCYMLEACTRLTTRHFIYDLCIVSSIRRCNNGIVKSLIGQNGCLSEAELLLDNSECPFRTLGRNKYIVEEDCARIVLTVCIITAGIILVSSFTSK